jgi:biopolymer transport protein ExbD
MRFAAPPRRRPAENIVPMINVVFLLLIFFLMTAQIAPPDPFTVTVPASDAGDPAPGPAVLYVSATGELAYGLARGDAVFAVLDPATPLLIRADTALEAAELARLLTRLAAVGLTGVALVTEPVR